MRNESKSNKVETIDAKKQGWKSLEDAKEHAVGLSNKFPGQYITFWSDFGIIDFFSFKSMPKSDYAPGDFPMGYARNGEWKAWSKKRKDRYTNAMIDTSD